MYSSLRIGHAMCTDSEDFPAHQLSRYFPLGVNLVTSGIPPFEKGGGRGDLNVAWSIKSPSIPLFQRGKLVEFSNGKSRLKVLPCTLFADCGFRKAAGFF